MATKASIKRMKFCNFKLDTLLKITRAINEDVGVDALLEKFRSLLLDELNIGKLIVYAFSTEWSLVLISGIKKKQIENISIQDDLLVHEEITPVSSTKNKKLNNFDFIIPVFHDTKPIAYVLIGDVEEEKAGVSPTIKHILFIQTLTNIIFVAVENKRLHDESIKQERLKKEMELASQMQAMLVPDANDFPKNDFVSIETFYLPHFDVGGDYYDFEKINDNELFFCIADVSGKGISAAILMSNFQASLKAFLHTKIKLPDLIVRLNERVVASAQGQKFITFFSAIYNYQTKELQYINAGHNAPFLFDITNNKLSELKDGTVGIGMLDEIPFINEGHVKIENSSKLICYTDGLAELENDNKEEIGLSELEKCMSNEKSVQENFRCLQKTLDLKKGNPALFDDITILGVDFKI